MILTLRKAKPKHFYVSNAAISNLFKFVRMGGYYL